MELIRLPFCLMFPILAQAQWISVGIMGGVPASPWSHQSPAGCLDTLTPICGPNDFLTRPYAVGPALDVNLPLGLSAEAGLLYQNFHQDITTGLIVSRGGSVNFGQRAGVSANGWLFPTLLKYHFGHSTVVPFVEAGATLRHLGVFDGNGVQVDASLIPQPAVFHIESGRALDAAITVGGGMRWRLLWMDIEPQFRYLHWTSAYYQPAQKRSNVNGWNSVSCEAALSPNNSRIQPPCLPTPAPLGRESEVIFHHAGLEPFFAARHRSWW